MQVWSPIDVAILSEIEEPVLSGVEGNLRLLSSLYTCTKFVLVS
jgi:hypothetical protein